MNICFKKIKDSYSNKLPFVVYRKPKETTISSFFLKDDMLYTTSSFTEKGFVFAPFNAEEKAVLFPLEKSEYLEEELFLGGEKTLKDYFKTNETSKEDHIKLVEKAIDEINNNELQKVVISRKELVAITDFNLVEIYQKLLDSYANAFVYVWFHPKIGLWLGATPETLLEIENTNFKTMSLAGTQVFKDTEDVIWKAKELEEQQLVTSFIENQLKMISSHLEIDKTETVRAGNLLHLKTKVKGVLDTSSNLKTLIRALHPTPAVCGLPRELARSFILENEHYTRSFYTGFLGELNLGLSSSKTVKSNLFVNLRCMQVEDNIASIYIGGGITKDSKAKKEWKETVAKSKVMKLVL
ncbi:chorismate-binding protein [Polaribacter sp. MSW13]|uniref:isochorismate synthase n=1 Tax=Polaribacter marinus TaxID=2916838 RepID=A0A9X1VNV9_9FLAO|nr:chorismate-binding protein [Polaribacter marinus]MCI2227890.1 chorismate-binding protein [Polaribacter marinus]